MAIIGHISFWWKAAPGVGAAFALSCLLVIGLLPLGSLGYAETPQAGEGTPVVVETTEPQPQPETPNIQDEVPTPTEPSVTTPSTSEVAPQFPVETPAPVEPVNNHTWFIGADDPSAVVAGLWEDGTFVIDGAGDVATFEDAESVPWLKAGFAPNIKRVIFADAIAPKSLAYWFEGCENLAEIANIPEGVKDLTHTFFDCPNLTELPNDLAFASDAKTEATFGFTKLPAEPLTTIYRGTSDAVLTYNWPQDTRTLINPDAPITPEPPTDQPDVVIPDTEKDPDTNLDTEPTDPTEPVDPAESTDPADSTGDPTNSDTESNSDVTAEPDVTTDPSANENPAVEEPQPAAPPAPQVSITVPSSVPLLLGQDGPNSASISVSIANRSEAQASIVGVRLKKANTDLPGGSWSLVSQNGTHHVDDARFTPLGLEAVLTTPVVLPPNSDNISLTWEGTFSDYGMKTLLEAAIASEGSFAYGTLIWHIEAI